MQGSYLRILFFLLILPILPYLTKCVTRASFVDQAKVSQLGPREEVRAQLLMGLDLLVRAERLLRAETGSYTRALGRIPDVLGALTHYYRIEFARATSERLLVVAVGEGRKTAASDGVFLVGDRVSIDEGFRVRTNFPVPEPKREYLHRLAQTVMNRIFANGFQIPGKHELDLWEGVFRGRFRYEVRPVSQGGRTIVAVGLSATVAGDVVEMESGADLFEWVYQNRINSPEWVEREARGYLEKIYFAQRIHQDHVGSYAPTFQGIIPNWNDLSSLSSEHSPFAAQEFQPDPTFGFHGEVMRKEQVSRGPSSEKQEPALDDAMGRSWSVNGYGQVSEISTIQGIMKQFDQASRKLTGEDLAAPVLAPPEGPVQVDKHKRLLIDPILDPSAK